MRASSTAASARCRPVSRPRPDHPEVQHGEATARSRRRTRRPGSRRCCRRRSRTTGRTGRRWRPPRTAAAPGTAAGSSARTPRHATGRLSTPLIGDQLEGHAVGQDQAQQDDRERREHHVELERGEPGVPVGRPPGEPALGEQVVAQVGRAPTRGRPCRHRPASTSDSTSAGPSWVNTNTTQPATMISESHDSMPHSPARRSASPRPGRPGSCDRGIDGGPSRATTGSSSETPCRARR